MAKKPSEQKPTDAFKREVDELKGGLVPTMTAPLALVYAKLLVVGCPPIRAVLYVAPQLADSDAGKTLAKKVAWQWTHDALVLQALSSINGGDWQELSKEQRFKLALEKSNAEAAFYLWTTNFGDVDSREGLDKIKIARDILTKELGGQIDADDPMQAFARFAHEVAKNMAANEATKRKRPPQMQLERGLDDPIM